MGRGVVGNLLLWYWPSATYEKVTKLQPNLPVPWIPSSYSCTGCPHNLPLGKKCTHRWPSDQLIDLVLEGNTAVIAKEAPLKIHNYWCKDGMKDLNFIILRIHVLRYISLIPDGFTLTISVARECRKRDERDGACISFFWNSRDDPCPKVRIWRRILGFLRTPNGRSFPGPFEAMQDGKHTAITVHAGGPYRPYRFQNEVFTGASFWFLA